MKTQRQPKMVHDSDKPKTTRKSRGSAAKISSANGKSQLATYEHAPIGIIECSPDGAHLNVNEEFCRLLGYEKKELVGKQIKDITHEDDYPIDIKLHQQLVEGKIPFYRLEKRFIHKNGKSIWTELTRSVIRDAAGKPLYTIGVVLDISDRRQVEKVLRESTERLRLATEAARMFTWELDLKTQMYTFADNFEKVLGFSAGLLPKNPVEHVERLSPHEDVRAFWDAFAKAVENHRDLHSLQMRLIDPENGQTIWLESNAKIVYDEAGNAERMFGVSQNITERRRMEQQLAREQELLERLFEAIPVMLTIYEPSTEVLRLNSQFERLIGWSNKETAGTSLMESCYPDPEYRQQVSEFMDTCGENEWMDIHMRTRAGRTLETSWSNIRLSDDMQVGIGIDITERKRTERRLGLLTEISELVRKLEDPNELLYAVSEAVGEHLQVRRCLFNEIDLEHDIEIVHRDYCRGVESVAGVHRISDYSSLTSAEMAAGKTVVNRDSKIDPRTAPDYERSYVQYGERAYMTVPLMRENRWVASLWVSDDQPRDWSEEEVSLLETIAERTWIAVEKLRLAEELNAREAELEAIITQTPFMLTRGTRDLRYRFVSRAYAEMIRRTPEEVAGKPIVEIMGEEGFKVISPYIEKVLQGEPIEFENEVPYQGVGTPFLHVAYTPDWDEAGNVIGWFASIVDISERKRTEKALSESEQRFREIFETAGVSVWLEDFTQVNQAIGGLRAQGVDDFRMYFLQHPDFVRSAIDLVRILDVNNETLDLFGAKSKEALLGSLSNVFAPETEQIFVEELLALAEGRETLRAETQVRALNGRPISVLFTVHFAPPTMDQSHVVVTLTDITERKRAEEKLRASETLYRTIARSIPGGGIYVVDKDMRYLVADGAVTEAFNLSREMLEGHTVSEVFRDAQRDKMIDRLNQNFGGETISYETEHDGRVYWTQQAPLYDSIGQAIIVTLDITERKRAEEALRQSEARFVQFMEHLPGLAWIKDLQGRYVYANASAEATFGTPRQELYGKTDEELFPSETAAQFQQNDKQALLDEKGIQAIETLQHEDGLLHYSLVNKFPIPGPDGNISLIGGTAFDITERLQAEEALRESEERLRAILRQATAGIVRKDAEGRLIYVNQAYCNMLGYTESELLGKPFWEFLHEEDVQENRRLYGRLMKEGIPFKLEKRLIREDGSILWTDVSVSPIMDAKGKPQSAVAVEVDITARKQAEENLRLLNFELEDRVQDRTAELEAMNQSLQEEIQERRQVEMALGESRRRLQMLSKRLVEVQEEERRAIARELHDRVGQTLSALNINLIIIKGMLLPDALEKVGPRFDDSMHLVGETITLVRDVMSNLRPAVLDDYGLEAALQSHLDEYTSRYGIKVIFDRPAQPIPRLSPSIEMTFLRIAQEALINIARHANASQVILSLWQEDDSVCMTMQDNGRGIVPGQEANRPGSHGLTIMHERAEAFGGNLTVSSVPGKGTKVEMSIPIGKDNQSEGSKEANK